MKKHRSLRLSLLAVPDTYLSCLSGLLDTLTLAREVVSTQIPFEPEIVAREQTVHIGRLGIPLEATRRIAAAQATDVVIIPASVLDGDAWTIGRYPEEVRWLARMYDRGAVLCSACSGALLLAETGLLNGREATTHWSLESTFQTLFPEVRLRLDRELIVSSDGRIVTSGAATAWHDLALHLIARFGGPATARSVARFFMLQQHSEGQTPYMSFDERLHHGDRVVRAAQRWLQSHWSEPNPVDVMTARSGLPARTFAHRFRNATGCAPLAYVQGLRIERAKRLLESGATPIETISAEVGYEDSSFFRRLFKRQTGLTPVEYRRRFSLERISRARHEMA